MNISTVVQIGIVLIIVGLTVLMVMVAWQLGAEIWKDIEKNS